jgi:hypothetical protein
MSRAQEKGPDLLLEEMISIKLTEEQMQFIMDNRNTMGTAGPDNSIFLNHNINP